MKIVTVTALISELYAENSKTVDISLCTSNFWQAAAYLLAYVLAETRYNKAKYVLR